MLPRYQKYPEIPFGSIGWRMGYGEAYRAKFDDWFADKPIDDKRRYAAENPAPESWKEFYVRKGIKPG